MACNLHSPRPFSSSLYSFLEGQLRCSSLPPLVFASHQPCQPVLPLLLSFHFSLSLFLSSPHCLQIYFLPNKCQDDEFQLQAPLEALLFSVFTSSSSPPSSFCTMPITMTIWVYFSYSTPSHKYERIMSHLPTNHITICPSHTAVSS